MFIQKEKNPLRMMDSFLLHVPSNSLSNIVTLFNVPAAY
jgi:hypothetical protein